MGNQQTIPKAGQTDAGSAGEQPARDNRPGRRNNVGVENPSTRLFQSPLCLKKLSAEGRFSYLTGKAICPIPAEPIHNNPVAEKELENFKQELKTRLIKF